MTKVAVMTIPPEFDALLAKILAHFNQMAYPCWASRFFHTTKSAKKANAEKTLLPHISALWSALTLVEKNAWKAAVGYTGYSGYQLFTAEQSYQRKHNTSLPRTPYTTHQLYGLKMSNPLATSPIRVRLHLKDLVGPLTLAFDYKKQEILPTGGLPFSMTATAYYFDAGLNLAHVTNWTAPSGNVAWTSVSISWGNAQRSYFHLIIEFILDNYNANTFLDNLGVTDGGGLFYGESFNKKVGQEWDYYPWYRKEGWAFDPEFAQPNFEVVYLDP
jgi:hypothetical protein